MTSADQFYFGDFKSGDITGKGVFTSKKGYTYSGDFESGRRQGQGKMTFEDGLYCEGTWV